MPNELLALARHDDDHRLSVVKRLAADLANPFFAGAYVVVIGISGFVLQCARAASSVPGAR
jgi:hypothetical protein